MLTKKVDALTKAMEVEWKKMKREIAAREKEVASVKSDDRRKSRSSNFSKRFFSDTFSFERLIAFTSIVNLNNAIKLLQGDERTLKILYEEKIGGNLYINASYDFSLYTQT